MKYANPKPGLYVSRNGQLFVLSNQNGPYSLGNEGGLISTYTFENHSGIHRKVFISWPFPAKRIGDFTGRSGK